jgi:hypothetical protein
MPGETQSLINFDRYVADHAREFTGREWIFEAINAWLDEPDGPHYFLLTGEPGSGKTAIASRLSQFSRGGISLSEGLSNLTQKFLSAYHFCSARDRRWISPHVFAKSLAIQLAGRYPAYTKALAERSSDETIHVEVKQHVGEVTGGHIASVVIENLDMSWAPAIVQA